ncbi:hypothetical protein [Mesorhizobium sp. WSM3224]|uniref:hypothetical protein n=1 Tax=Mesorhizobium sp. WSM3224 TaxID=1040986 RepID=UPI000486BCA2|nr:hypothetical protein [Mesorhizobium sp. WSM3224]
MVTYRNMKILPPAGVIFSMAVFRLALFGPLKIEFRKECWFDPGQGHNPSLFELRMAGHPS